MADTVNDTKDGRLPNPMTRDALQMQHAASESNAFAHGSVGNKMIDLNAWPRQAHGQPSSTQVCTPFSSHYLKLFPNQCSSFIPFLVKLVPLGLHPGNFFKLVCRDFLINPHFVV